MNPAQSFQLCNHNITPTYVHDRVWAGYSKHDNWCLVSTTSKEKVSRKRSSSIIEKEDAKCNGFTVKWDAGACSPGRVFPLVGIFSGFSRQKIPFDSFVVIEVKGMCVNSHLEVRCKEIGYVVLLRSNEKMDQFFEWCDNNVLCPCCRQLLEQCLAIPENHSTKFHEKYHSMVFVDSNMQ